MAIIRLQAGLSGQVLEHYPATRQETAAWELHDLSLGEGSTGRVLASGVAAVDAAENVTTAAAGPGQPNPARITGPTAGVAVALTYEISHPDGQSEEFSVAGISSGSYVTASMPLMGQFPVGSTVRGRRLVATTAIPDAVVEDDTLLEAGRHLRVVWTYEDDSKVQQQARVVRHEFGDVSAHDVEVELRRLWPDISTRLEHNGQSMLPGLIQSAQSELETKLRQQGLEPTQYLIGDQGKWAVAWRVLNNQSHMSNVPASTTPERWQDFTERRAEDYWQHLVSGGGGEETTEVSTVDDTQLPRHSHESIRLC